MLEIRCCGLVGGVGSPDVSLALAAVGLNVAASGLNRPEVDRSRDSDDELVCSMFLLPL